MPIIVGQQCWYLSDSFLVMEFDPLKNAEIVFKQIHIYAPYER